MTSKRRHGRATARARTAVRNAVASLAASVPSPLVLVGLSGGADSLALAAAAALESEEPARTATHGWRAGAIIIDHGLQHGSEQIAERAARLARRLGLDPVVLRRVRVATDDPSGGGLEAAARTARFDAFEDVVGETGADALLLAHTSDDQAEQVLLALARGSGTRSIAGIPPERDLGGARIIRPFLAPDAGIGRSITAAVCREMGLDAWADPHNRDPAFARVRVRERVLPIIERELGGGALQGLVRTADAAREDADALDALAEDTLAGLDATLSDGRAEVSAAGLATLAAAVRNRVIRSIVQRCFGATLTRAHTLAIADLTLGGRGRGPAFVPGVRVTRAGDRLTFERQIGSPRAAARDALR